LADEQQRATFSGLVDPVEIARAYAAAEAAWQELTRRFRAPDIPSQMLSAIVARHIHRAANDHDLVRRSVADFLSSQRSA